MGHADGVVVGLDNGGTSNNATVLDASGRFLVDRLVETPSRVTEGPDVAVPAMAEAFDRVLRVTGVPSIHGARRGTGHTGPGQRRRRDLLEGLDELRATRPGAASTSAARSRTCSACPSSTTTTATRRRSTPTTRTSAERSTHTSSVSAIVGTGLGGGVVESGAVVRGAAGMAGELGHVAIPTDGLLEDGQPVPECNCGLRGDVESFASLTGITKNLLPYWLTRFPGHPLADAASPAEAARAVRSYGEKGDPLARSIFTQQAVALGRLFTLASNFTDPDAYFLGGGVVESEPGFREWFLATVREHTVLREEQQRVATFALIPHLDMAGARGSALAAWDLVRRGA